VAFQSYFGVSPCRVWLRDLDHDNVPECLVGGNGTDVACYDLRAMKCRWTFAGPLHPRDIALCDVDGDGELELVAGCADSFLYVLGRDGQFRFSRSAGAPVTALCAVAVAKRDNPGASPGDRLAVGLATGHVLLLGPDLKPLGSALLDPPEPVTHLSVLRRQDGRLTIVAAGDAGACMWINP
jgi:hypothetical protein